MTISINSAFGEICGMLGGDETTLLAGGYVRDSALGKKPKDADFFAWSKPMPTSLRQAMRERGWKRKESSPYAASIIISSVYTNTTRYDLPVDLVFVNVPPKVFVEDHFDWGLCKCWMEYDGSTHFTPHFNSDYENKRHTVWYDPAILNAFTVLEHGKRLQAKYNWPLEVKYG